MEPGSTPPADPLISRLATVAERHARLLALRLAAVADELQDRCPETTGDPVFAAAWDRFGSFRGGTLRAALEEPVLEAWVGQVETLLRSPALQACPGHHLPRALARFSALLPNLAGCEGGASQGTAVVLGAASIPVLLGSAQLRPATARRTLVHWSWDETLRLSDEHGATLAELEPADGLLLATGEGWHAERARQTEGMRIFAHPRCVQHPQAVTVPDFPDAFTRAARGLPDATRHLLRLATRAAGPRCSRHPVTAHSWLEVDGSPTAQTLARSLASNLVGLCAAVHRFDTSRRLSETMAVATREDLVTAVTEELSGNETAASGSTLDRMLAACESRPAPSSVPASVPEPEARLDFRPVLARAGIPIEDRDPWIQRKCRRLDRAPRWRVLDALSELTAEQLDRLRNALCAWPEAEIRQFGLACLDYHQGRFPAAAGHALECVDADGGCEDYWLLLAFCLRHLRRFDVFDDIVFTSLRADSVLEKVRRSL
jgi:hypothetical protein